MSTVVSAVAALSIVGLWILPFVMMFPPWLWRADHTLGIPLPVVSLVIAVAAAIVV